MIEFTIPVKPVTKKNNKRIIPIRTKTGKVRHIPLPSKDFEEFEKKCIPYFFRVKSEAGIVNYPINMRCVFYVEKRLRYDLTNLLEAIDDAMVKSGLLIDDNRDIIAGHDGSRVFHDKYNPRIEVQITEIKNYSQWKVTTLEQKKLI